MTRKLAILAAAVALTMGAGAASAGGGLKGFGDPEPSRCSGGPFAGMYVGAHIGYAEHELSIHDQLSGWTGDDEDGSFTGGLVSGYNIQCGRLLIGYEGDINFLDSDPTIAVGGGISTTLNGNVDWYGTSRLRLGLVHNDNVLIFVSGGLAYGEVDHTLASPALNFRRSDSDTQYGWTLGGGVEFLRAGNWTFRAEGYYVDLGEETESYDAGGCGLACRARVEWEDEFWTARVGLTYKFGRREEAVPLK